MVYKALYRTYRPQKFSEVIGQDHIVRTLQNSIVNNKTSHAYLFSGPRGTGKTSVARIFAKALNCASPKNMEPCGECLSCQEISQSMSPDVVEIDAASNNGVDEIREIRDKVKFLPGGSKFKIYIIDEVHMLSQGAFNALLKTLEEPPKHVIFILATTEPHKVIPTILSRCQRFDFKTLSVQEIASVIKSVSLKEGFNITDEAIIAIAEGAEGGMRDALSFLDQAASFTDDEITIDDVNSVTGNLNFDKIVELAKFFEEKNMNKALKTINDLVIMGKEINKIVSSLLQFYRDCLLYKNIDVSMFSKYIFEKEDFKILAEKISVDKIFYYIDILSDVQTKIKLSSTPTIYLEVATIKMINSSDDDFLYNKRIKELEERLENLNLDGNSKGADNIDKVNSLELKLNKVINELSRLELHKLVEKVDSLEFGSPSVQGDYSKFEQEIETLKQYYRELESKIGTSNNEEQSDFSEEINELKNAIIKLKHEVGENRNKESFNNTSVNSIDSDIDDKIQKLKNIILGMQSDIYSLRSMKQETEQVNLDELKAELDDIYLNRFSAIETELKNIKAHNLNLASQNVNTNQTLDDDIVYELERIKEKVNSIESKVYKLMSGELEKVTTKKPKTKVNRRQIVLFGDEVMNINDFKKPIKESVDFEDIQEDKEFEEDLDIEPVEDKVEVEVYNDESSSMFSEDENTKEVIETKKEEKPIVTIKTENEEIIEREHSSLVRKINTEQPPAVEERQEVVPKVKDTNVIEKEEYVTTTHKYTPPMDMANDEFSNYDVAVLERILHDSRSEIARNDKVRIMNLWKNLDRSVPNSQLHIASLLQDGNLVATGIKEFVLVYPNAALCNQVMRMSFKKESLKLLYDFLGDTYNYFAVPENIWIEKRTEYINQYNIGTRYPKLTPINDSNLSVIEENREFLRKQDSSKSKAVSFFGEELVKVE
ncbi:MAG: DNA polymerase III subunit gamma/tau [Bacilli bacterium]|nr:DNA polymerase III subunit gamma/tau [Bacilli bacterium]